MFGRCFAGRGYVSVFILALASLALVACGDAASPAEQPDSASADQQLCDEATAHIQQCMDSSVMPFPDGECDPAVAEELLATDCQQITEPGKSDWASDALCRAGLLHHCTVPACDSGLPYDHDFSDVDDCAALLDKTGCAACDYYRCREAKSVGQCGADGYYLGFGYKYCLRYRQLTEPLMTSRGQQWSAGTRHCLMQTLEDRIEDSADCDGLIQAGYDSHPQCYLGTGFCQLSPYDWLLILNTIDPADMDFSLMFETGADCLREYLHGK